jgi:translation elongation factor P/translation initiation factor 5A
MSVSLEPRLMKVATPRSGDQLVESLESLRLRERSMNEIYIDGKIQNVFDQMTYREWTIENKVMNLIKKQ